MGLMKHARSIALLALSAALLGIAGYAIAQVPTLFVTSLTGTEQINVVVPSTGTLVTNPQIQSVTTNTLKSFIGSSSQGVNNQTGASYTLLAADMGKLVTSNNGSAVAWTLAQCGTAGFGSGQQFSAHNIGAGAVTITPTTSTINGASTYVLNQNRGAQIFCDGSNWQVEDGAAGLAVTPVAVTEGGTGATTASAARTGLGLGTSATVNTGTSGATIPLLNGNNTYSGTSTFSGQIISTTGLPTIASGACGTTTNGAVVAGSTNQSGNITIGAVATTTCTVSFSATLGTAPNACVIFPTNAAGAATGTTVARVSSVTTAQFVITGSALANANYEYICL